MKKMLEAECIFGLMKKMLVLTIVLISACQPVQNQPSEQPANPETYTIAFGSCNKEDLPQVMWQDIINQDPDLWIWLGDNIYGDSEVIDTLRTKYQKVLKEPGYQQLKAKASVIGTWDDHDYGKNDGGYEFVSKEESQQAFLDFFDVPENDPRRTRKGVYSKYEVEVGTLKVKVLLLDSRYHRDTVDRVDGVYQTNDSGTVLGAAQWNWLENELTDSEADVHIIGNGIQYLAQDHRFEKWANFPNERQKLLELIAKSQAKGVVLLSGDRHIAEVSEVQIERMDYPIRDITASGLTHSYEKAGDEPNRHRVSPLIGMKNFGTITISSAGTQALLEVQLKGLNDTTFYAAQWKY